MNFFKNLSLDKEPRSLSAKLYRRSLLFVYFFAFLSLFPQVKGLLGVNGILPTGLPLSDLFLQSLALAGAGFSLLAFFNVLPGLFLFLLWGLYLFFTTFGGDFLSFQWDTLLLETGLISCFIFWNESGKNDGKKINRCALFLLQLLLFRLMFGSGVVKLTSGDPAWRNLLAMTFHYETQPIPSPLAWYVHQLPGWFQRASCFLVFVIELILPWGIWGPSWMKIATAGVLIIFQLMIMFTGNYAFFNLLTIALCLLLIPDTFWKQCLNKLRFDLGPVPDPGPPPVYGKYLRRAKLTIVLIFFLFQGLLQTLQFCRLFFSPSQLPHVSPLFASNFYGLFAVMTTERREIVVEGSFQEKGTDWRPYGFKFKPGETEDSLKWVAPHQPRLDWQMWFASLGTFQDNPWFISFMYRLLQGRPEVTELLSFNPFASRPPNWIRGKLYLYHFSTWEKEGGLLRPIWKRKELGLYLPPVSLESFRK